MNFNSQTPGNGTTISSLNNSGLQQ